MLVEFTFLNLLIYLDYGREKAFDMQSMKAFRSLKAYTVYAVIFEGHKFCGFCCKLVEREILILEKEAVA